MIHRKVDPMDITATMALTEFLLARIAEDEAAALKLRGTGFARWERVEYGDGVPGGYIPNVWGDWRPHPPVNGDSSGLGFVPLSDHIARHDPARALAECEAKRAIVERCAAVDFAMPSTHLAHGMLAELTAVYSDHPDYRPEWAPGG